MSADTAPDFDIDNFEMVHIGPSWQKDENGEYILPERSLGYECLRWCFEYLKGPDGGPWRFTAEQARIVLWWYALDERGDFLYRSGVVQRAKG